MTRTLASNRDKAARAIKARHEASFTKGDRRQQRLRRAFDKLAELRHHDRLWQHQIETLARLKEHFAHDLKHPNAIAVIPTAGGKTEIFGRVVVAHAQTAGPGEKPAMILVPTRNLASQTVTRLASLGLQAVSRRWPVAPGKTVGAIVLTYAAFQEYVHAGLLDHHAIDLLVLDEAHCALSELRRPALTRFEGRCPILAFSATPAYDLMKNVYAVLGRDNEVLCVTPETLRERGVIAPAINYVLAIAMNGIMPEDGREVVRQLRAAARNAVLQFRRDHVETDLGLAVRDKHFLGYHATCADAMAATAHHNIRSDEDGIVTNLGGTDSTDMQDRTIQALRNGEIVGINNANLLIEGTDIQTVGAVLNFVPTYSLVREIQRCGRGLRLDPRYDVRDPRQTSIIVDVFFEINGRVVGRPRFYFEVVNDTTIARIVRYGAVEFESSSKPTAPSSARPTRSRGGKTKRVIDKPGISVTPPATGRSSEGYIVSSDVRTVEYLVQTRDRTSGAPAYDHWMTREEIIASLGFIDHERADTIFGQIESEMSGKDFGIVHEFGPRRIRAGTYLRRGNPNLVYDSEQRDVLAALLDYAPRKITPLYQTGVQILGLHANQPEYTARMAALEQACLDSRRATRAIEQTVHLPGLSGSLTFDLMRVGKSMRIAFPEKLAPEVAAACGITRTALEDLDTWVDRETLIEQINPAVRERARQQFRELNQRYEHKADADGVLTVATPWGSVRFARIAVPGNGTQTRLAVHCEDVERFVASRHHPNGPDESNWLTWKEVQAALGIASKDSFWRMWKRITRADAYPSSQLRYKQTTARTGQTQIRLHRDDLPGFKALVAREADDITASLGSEWIAPRAVIDLLVERGMTATLAIRRMSMVRGKLNLKEGSQEIALPTGMIRVNLALRNRMRTAYYHREDLDRFINYIEAIQPLSWKAAAIPSKERSPSGSEYSTWLDEADILRHISRNANLRRATLRLERIFRRLATQDIGDGTITTLYLSDRLVLVKCDSKMKKEHAFSAENLSIVLEYLTADGPAGSIEFQSSQPPADSWIRLDTAWRGLTKYNLGRILGQRLMDSLPPQFERESEPTVRCAGVTFKVKLIRSWTLGVSIASVSRKDHAALRERLLALGAPAEPLPEHMRTRDMWVTGRSHDPVKLETIWSELKERFENGMSLEFNGHPVEAGYYRHRRINHAFAVDVATANRIAEIVRKRRPAKS